MRVLTSYEENQVVESIKKHARESCLKEVEEFVQCAKGLTFSVTWKCRSQFNVMNKCTHEFTNSEAADKVRLEYIKDKQNQK